LNKIASIVYACSTTGRQQSHPAQARFVVGPFVRPDDPNLVWTETRWPQVQRAGGLGACIGALSGSFIGASRVLLCQSAHVPWSAEAGGQALGARVAHGGPSQISLQIRR
jgi:hypothetical protein